MRFLLIAVGSRGDAEPFCSLAEQLAVQKQQPVDLMLQTDHTAPSLNQLLHVHRMPFVTNDFYKYSSKPKVQHDNPRVRFVGIVAEIIGELVLPCYSQVQALVKDDTIVIASSLARQLALALHQRPTYLVQLQPMQPNELFPHYSHTEECVEALLGQSSTRPKQREKSNYLETYLEPERYQHQFLLDRLERLYEIHQLGPIPTFAEIQSILTGQTDGAQVVNAFSNLLVPTDNEWHVGPLADTYHGDTYDPPPDLVEFLHAFPNPICVGYGSMPFAQVSVVLEALTELKQPAILVGRCFTSASMDTFRGNFFAIDTIPYPWLFPQCRIVLHHGGAGVVHAALRAGAAHVISPLMGDQFFWGRLLEQKQLASVSQQTLSNVTKEGLVRAIRQAETCVENAKEMGQSVRRQVPSGVYRFAEQLITEHAGLAN